MCLHAPLLTISTLLSLTLHSVRSQRFGAEGAQRGQAGLSLGGFFSDGSDTNELQNTGTVPLRAFLLELAQVTYSFRSHIQQRVISIFLLSNLLSGWSPNQTMSFLLGHRCSAFSTAGLGPSLEDQLILYRNHTSERCSF